MHGDLDFLKLDQSRLDDLVSERAADYRSASPFEHTVIDDFLPPVMAEALLAGFPDPDDPVWLDWRKRNVENQPGKLGLGEIFSLYDLRHHSSLLLTPFNSAPFVRFLEGLTGIEGLCPDPYFMGGGMHQILPGGLLRVHSDFNYHARLKLFRRINVLIYLNKDWRPEYKGALELWDTALTRPEKEILPIFNRAVIFNTKRDAFHGHPRALKAPMGMTRKSVALYYYTAAPAEGDETPRLGQYHSVGDERTSADIGGPGYVAPE